jgi:hypothetical protein
LIGQRDGQIAAHLDHLPSNLPLKNPNIGRPASAPSSLCPVLGTGGSMIHVISSANRDLYESIIEHHFRLRQEVFVSERQWNALERPKQREIDAFDNEDTIYLLEHDCFMLKRILR